MRTITSSDAACVSNTAKSPTIGQSMNYFTHIGLLMNTSDSL